MAKPTKKAAKKVARKTAKPAPKSQDLDSLLKRMGGRKAGITVIGIPMQGETWVEMKDVNDPVAKEAVSQTPRPSIMDSLSVVLDQLDGLECNLAAHSAKIRHVTTDVELPPAKSDQSEVGNSPALELVARIQDRIDRLSHYLELLTASVQ